MASDLSENSTKEEIEQYAEEVVKEVAEERKGDAEIVTDTAKPANETPAVEESGSEAAPEGDDTVVAESQDDDTGEASWLTDDVKAEAAAFGIEESEIADFASREEFDRALRLFDKSAMEAGRKALEESPPRDEKGKFAKKEEPEAETPTESGYKISLDKDIYDEDIVKELTGLRDHYESRIEALDSRLQQAEAKFAEAEALAEIQRFDSAIDSLDMPKLFGVTGKETQEQLKKREEVLAQAKVIQAGYSSFGRDVEVDALVSRVAPMVFSSEFDKQKLKAKTRKISKQSNGRQGGGATRPQDPREDPRDEADRLYRELERA